MRTLLALLASTVLSLPAGARILGQGDPAMPARAALVDGWGEPGGTRILGFLVELEPGWKTYWRAPGDLGIPPRLDWSGSENVASVEVMWPVPQVFEAGGEFYAGYAGAMLLPLRVQAADAARPMVLRLAAGFGVCRDVCLPAEAVVEVAVSLTAGRAEAAGLLKAAMAALPVPAGAAGLQGIDCTLAPTADGLSLEAELRFADAPQPVAMGVVEAPVEDLWIAPASVEITGRALRISTAMQYFGDGPLALDRDGLRFTLIGAGGAVEHLGCRLR